MADRDPGGRTGTRRPRRRDHRSWGNGGTAKERGKEVSFFRHSPRLLAGNPKCFRGSPCQWPQGVTILLVLAFLSSCVPVPPELLPKAPGAGAPAATSFPDIEPSGTTFSSLHFSLHGYNPSELQEISHVAEDIFNKIGNDTGLYSYLA